MHTKANLYSRTPIFHTSLHTCLAYVAFSVYIVAVMFFPGICAVDKHYISHEPLSLFYVSRITFPHQSNYTIPGTSGGWKNHQWPWQVRHENSMPEKYKRGTISHLCTQTSLHSSLIRTLCIWASKGALGCFLGSKAPLNPCPIPNADEAAMPGALRSQGQRLF